MVYGIFLEKDYKILVFTREVPIVVIFYFNLYIVIETCTFQAPKDNALSWSEYLSSPTPTIRSLTCPEISKSVLQTRKRTFHSPRRTYLFLLHWHFATLRSSSGNRQHCTGDSGVKNTPKILVESRLPSVQTTLFLFLQRYLRRCAAPQSICEKEDEDLERERERERERRWGSGSGLTIEGWFKKWYRLLLLTSPHALLPLHLTPLMVHSSRFSLHLGSGALRFCLVYCPPNPARSSSKSLEWLLSILRFCIPPTNDCLH